MKEKIINHCLVMNSVSNAARTVRYLSDRHLTHIRTFLDNDDAGQKTVQDFIRAGFKLEDMFRYYKDFKDLNEFYVSRVREKQIQDTSIKAKQIKHKIR